MDDREGPHRSAEVPVARVQVARMLASYLAPAAGPLPDV